MNLDGHEGSHAFRLLEVGRLSHLHPLYAHPRVYVGIRDAN